ncbi:MAG: N-formylglutamate amidohydrolase, partial [Alphaproteobacteria bacterium]|nr:N-formylglutamate amidohydrolase [Alphaproteobacteria bacterium]
METEDPLDDCAYEFSGDDFNVAFEITRPQEQLIPYVFASPHSGTNYPDSFVDASKLDPISLRGSE